MKWTIPRSLAAAVAAWLVAFLLLRIPNPHPWFEPTLIMLAASLLVSSVGACIAAFAEMASRFAASR